MAMVGIPETLATNSALGGTLKRFSEDFLQGFMLDCLPPQRATQGRRERVIFRFLQNENILAESCDSCGAVRAVDRRTSTAHFRVL